MNRVAAVADTRAVLLAFIEDGSLELLEGIEDARGRYAGCDVQSGVVRFKAALRAQGADVDGPLPA